MIQKIFILFSLSIFSFSFFSCGDSPSSSSENFAFWDQYATENQLQSSSSSNENTDSLSSSIHSENTSSSSTALSSSEDLVQSSGLISSNIEQSSSSTIISSSSNESSSSIDWNYDEYFKPESCVGLLCDVIDPGELGVQYEVPRSSILPDINNLSFTHPTLVHGTDTLDTNQVRFLTKIQSFQWSGTNFTSQSNSDQKNYIQGSFEWSVASANNPSQTNYGGNIQLRDQSSLNFVENPQIKISGTGTLMDGSFLLNYIDNVLVFVEKSGRYAIEWRL